MTKQVLKIGGGSGNTFFVLSFMAIFNMKMPRGSKNDKYTALIYSLFTY